MGSKVWSCIVALAILGLIGGFAPLAEADSARKGAVAYPEKYREWRHVKSMVIQAGHPLYEAFGGLHHIYANDKAYKAMTQGRSYPDGAVLVFDLLEAQAADNALVEGPRKVLGVMQKDAKRFAATGGWGFEGFKGDTRDRVVTDAKAQCFDCHTAQKESDFVFSQYRR